MNPEYGERKVANNDEAMKKLGIGPEELSMMEQLTHAAMSAHSEVFAKVAMGCLLFPNKNGNVKNTIAHAIMTGMVRSSLELIAVTMMAKKEDKLKPISSEMRLFVGMYVAHTRAGVHHADSVKLAKEQLEKLGYSLDVELLPVVSQGDSQ